MNLFVTGATGFIGSNLINKAHEIGYSVFALRRTINSKPRVNLLKEPVWITKQLDEITCSDLKNIDCIIHLAAHSMTPPYDTLENCMYWNVMAPINLFKEAIKVGIKKIIVAGSCFEYGASGEKYDFIPIEAPLMPTSSYAVSKAALYLASFQLALEKKLELSYHRIFHVYGEGEAKSRFWPSLKKAADSGEDFEMTFGEQVRDFVPVKFVCNRLLMFCENVDLQFPYLENLGTGKPERLISFARRYWNLWGATGEIRIGKIPYRENEVMRYVPFV